MVSQGSDACTPMRWKCSEMLDPCKGGSWKLISGSTEPLVGSRPCMRKCSRDIWTYEGGDEGKDTFLKIWECNLRERSCTPSSFLLTLGMRHITSWNILVLDVTHRDVEQVFRHQRSLAHYSFHVRGWVFLWAGGCLIQTKSFASIFVGLVWTN